MSSPAISSASTTQPAVDRLRQSLPLLFGSTILTSACLLFLVQPLISKMILPWFGGSAAVWVTAMLFFQTCLLLGYFYAHFLTTLLGTKTQAVIHISLLVLSLAFLPIYPNPRWLPQPGDDPTLAVFAVLGSCIGLPYTLLSATSPLIQKWFSQSNDNALPYRYFALSNAGSMLALFAFPLFIEPRMTGHQQSYLWSAAFIVFAALCAGSGLIQLRTRRGTSRPDIGVSDVGVSKVTFGTLTLWTALAACASALLLIVTSLLTQNIAPMPLLWVLPLGVYLLTFILCFESSIWYQRWVFLVLLLPALAYIAFVTRIVEDDFELPQVAHVIIPLLMASLFVACMTCHGELVRLKPDPGQLTNFYLAIATGGALGGLTVALLAPRFFKANYEYPIVLTTSAIVVLCALWRGRKSWTQPRLGLGLSLAALAAVIGLAYYASLQFQANQLNAQFLARNFYGALRVDEFHDETNRAVRQLNHGTIAHGNQFLDPVMRHVATTYYGRESGAGLTWRILEQAGPIKLGVIGLGTGTMAAYGRRSDTIRFYEINPLMVDIARNHFSYLSDSAAKIDISLGDARLELEHEQPQNFDMLVVDAFSGDAIPVHLLTAEAFQLYKTHLKPDGVLVVHISNRYLRLEQIVKAAAYTTGFEARLVSNADDDPNGVFQSDYVLVTNRQGFFTNPLLNKQAERIEQTSGIRGWTDDFSNIWQLLHL